MIDNGAGTSVDDFFLFCAHDDDNVSGFCWIGIESIDIAGLVATKHQRVS